MYFIVYDCKSTVILLPKVANKVYYYYNNIFILVNIASTIRRLKENTGNDFEKSYVVSFR